jgi:cytoskeletal protein RodZ
MAADRIDFGSRLRAAREARGISLKDIAAATKISMLALEALERNDVARLPGGLFSRAFVRAYAKQVGLDPEQAVREFANRLSQDAETAAVQEPVRRRASRAGASHAGLGWLGLAITLVLVVFWIGVDRYFSRRAETPASATRSAPADASPRAPAPPPLPQAEAPKAPSAVEQVAAPGGNTQDAGAMQPAPQVPSQPVAPAPANPATTEAGLANANLPLRIVVSPRAACWVSVSVDGKRMPGRTLQPGEPLELAAGQSIVLTAGDAGALDYTINNAPGRPLGAAGQVATVVITTTNYRTFLAARQPQ